jgi:hypothetical protein
MVSSGLAILNAEVFDDGFRSQRRGQAKAGTPAILGDAMPATKKKRGRPQVASDEDEPEEDKKRPRGRPRLDTTDQTAKDVSWGAAHPLTRNHDVSD